MRAVAALFVAVLVVELVPAALFGVVVGLVAVAGPDLPDAADSLFAVGLVDLSGAVALVRVLAAAPALAVVVRPVFVVVVLVAASDGPLLGAVAVASAGLFDAVDPEHVVALAGLAPGVAVQHVVSAVLQLAFGVLPAPAVVGPVGAAVLAEFVLGGGLELDAAPI